MKKKTAATAKAKKAPAKKTTATEKEGVGIEFVAGYLEVNEFTARGKLRKAGVQKEGSSYWWPSEAAAKKALNAAGL